MDEFEFAFTELRLLQRKLARELDMRLRADFDLPLAIFTVMSVVADLAPCSAVRLAAESRTSLDAMLVMIPRLERRGLCLVNTDNNDVSGLTLRGSQLFREASRVFDEELSQLLGAADLSDSIRQLKSELSILVRRTGTPRQQSGRQSGPLKSSG